jgi:hypothetical protein
VGGEAGEALDRLRVGAVVSDSRLLESGGGRSGEGATFRALESYGVGYDPLTAIPWLAVFWAEDPAVTPPANGAVVTSWNQPGATALDEWAIPSAPATTEPPHFISSWTNGRPALDFLQGDRIATTIAAAPTSTTTVAIVGETTTSDSDLCDDEAATDHRLLIDRGTGGTEWRMYQGVLVATITPADSDPHLFVGYFSTPLTELFVDGTRVIGPTTGGSNFSNVIALGSSANNFDHGQSKIAFAGVIDRQLTTGEVADLLAWYQDHYVAAAPVYGDDFNRADTTYGLGPNWILPGVTGDGYQIFENKCHRRVTAEDYAVFDVDLGTPDHWVEADISGAGGEFVVINARGINTPGQNAYLGFLSPGVSEAVIGKVVAGSYSPVNICTGVSHGPAHKLRLEVEGSNLRLYLDDVLVCSDTDTDLTTGNYTGINSNASQSCIYDNFRCGPLPYTPP